MAEAVHNPAMEAAERATKQMLECLESDANFVLEAGAGAGKTYSLIEALRYIVRRNGREFIRLNDAGEASKGLLHD
jgi:DNA helicase-2/ATP-dependent DNA helicase PcrA